MEPTKMLIVDDEPSRRFFLAEALNKQGYMCDEAREGQEAIERVQENRPDIVILDLKMPRMGGMEALKKIRALDSDIAVIIVTAFGTRETTHEAIQAGAYDCFSKPADINEVRVVVGRAAERVRLLRTGRQLQGETEQADAPERSPGQSPRIPPLRGLPL